MRATLTTRAVLGEPPSRPDRTAGLVALLATLGAAALAAPTAAQDTTVVPTGTDAYITRPVEAAEAITLAITPTEPLPSRIVSVIDPEGAELDCEAPCTIRARAGRLVLRSERLDASIDVTDPGLTYDVTITPGPEPSLIGLGLGLTLGGALVAGLGIWGLTEPGLDENLVTAATLGAVFGAIFALIGLPMTIWMLATVNGQANVTGYRVSGAGVATSVRF